MIMAAIQVVMGFSTAIPPAQRWCIGLLPIAAAIVTWRFVDRSVAAIAALAVCIVFAAMAYLIAQHYRVSRLIRHLQNFAGTSPTVSRGERLAQSVATIADRLKAVEHRTSH